MGYPTVYNDVQNIAAGAVVNIRPAADTQAWRVTEIGSDQWVGVLPNAIPDVTVDLFDGTIAGSFLLGTQLRGWYRPQNFVIDRNNYLRLTNTNAAAADLSWVATLISEYGAGASLVRSDVQAVAAGATIDIRPAADTEDWIVRDIGSSAFLGAAPNGVPNVEVDLFDGTNAARLLDSTEARGWEHELAIYVSRGNYIRLTNAAAVQANLCWSAELLTIYGAGATIVRSDILVAGAGANVDFRPAAGEEWEVNLVGSSVWVGISPLQFPDITVFLMDNAAGLASQIQTPTSWKGNGHASKLTISNGQHLRVNDASGAGQNVGISAVLVQRYA